MLENRKFFTLFPIRIAASLHCFIFLRQCLKCHNFKYFRLYGILKLSRKKFSLALHLIEIDTLRTKPATDPDPDPDRQVLDADPVR
jgi:hypothetical protein